MKIYILRHEDRTHDCTFFSPLTEFGLTNSIKLIKYLDMSNINLIFSSPFIRTLQTVFPFVKNKGYKINIEYGLSEIHHEDIIPKKSVGLLLPEYLGKYYNYNCNYESIISTFNIKYPEKYKDVVTRIKIILKNLIENYINTDYNILLVTHQSLCKAMLEIINSCNSNLIIDSFIINNYPKGQITLIFNNEWCFKLIN
jgi:broad specificity phosphatase PhoE